MASKIFVKSSHLRENRLDILTRSLQVLQRDNEITPSVEAINDLGKQLKELGASHHPLFKQSYTDQTLNLSGIAKSHQERLLKIELQDDGFFKLSMVNIEK
jgi:hypothetical protein